MYIFKYKLECIILNHNSEKEEITIFFFFLELNVVRSYIFFKIIFVFFS